MPQLQTAIVGHNNTQAQVTGQEELLVKVNSGTVDVNIVSPLGNQKLNDSVSVVLTPEQAAVAISPAIIISSGDTPTSIASPVRSISFASNGTADALISFDSGITYVSIPTGTTINMDAGGLHNYYDVDIFYYDTATNAGSSLLITYNQA